MRVEFPFSVLSGNYIEIPAFLRNTKNIIKGLFLISKQCRLIHFLTAVYTSTLQWFSEADMLLPVE